MVALNSLAVLIAASSLLPTLFAAPLNVRHSETKRIAHRRRCKASRPPATTTATSYGSKETGKKGDNGDGDSDSGSGKGGDDDDSGKDDGDNDDGDNGDSGSGGSDDGGDGDSGSSDPPATGSAALRLVWPVSVSDAKSSWSTSDAVADNMKLNDDTLDPKSTDGSDHYYGTAEDGTPDTLVAKYQAGASSPGHSGSKSTGFGLYAKGPTDLTKGTEVLFSYKAYFEKDFDWVLGGKMPGLFGGVDWDHGKQCSGGRYDGYKCWSTRMMWRDGGKGELYAYFPPNDDNTNALEKIEHSHKAGDYGFSTGTGLFHWKKGAWTSISQRIKLNDPDESNGELDIYVDGERVMKIRGLRLRDSSDGRVQGMQIQTFRGGHDSSWAGDSTQYAYFKDFSAAVLS